MRCRDVARLAGAALLVTGMVPRSTPVAAATTTPSTPAAAFAGPLAGGTTREVQVAGQGGVDPEAATAVLNLTVTGPVAPGYLTVWPCGAPRPTASNLNYVAGQTVANAVVSAIGADGRVCVFASTTADVVIDAEGWLPANDRYTPVTPERVLDTRTGLGGRSTKLDGDVLQLRLGFGGAVAVFNVTVTGTEADGYLTVWPCGSERPTTSNVNWTRGRTVANLVITGLRSDGTACIYAQTRTDVVVDLAGSFAGTETFVPIRPARLLDTRDPALGGGARVEPGGVARLAVTGPADAPPGAAAVALNVTATDTGPDGYLTVWPCDEPRPLASNLNHRAGETVANLAVVRPDAAGDVCIYSQSGADLVVDVSGWLAGGSAYHALRAPRRILDTRSGIGDAVEPAVVQLVERVSVDQLPFVLDGAFRSVPAAPLEFEVADSSVKPPLRCTADAEGRLTLASTGTLPYVCVVFVRVAATERTSAVVRPFAMTVGRAALSATVVERTVTHLTDGWIQIGLRIRYEPGVVTGVSFDESTCQLRAPSSVRRPAPDDAEWLVSVEARSAPCLVVVVNADDGYHQRAPVTEYVVVA